MEVFLDSAKLQASRDALEGLLPAFQRLDQRLAQVTSAAEAAYGPGATTDVYRGLQIGWEDIKRLLARAPAAPVFAREATGAAETISLVREGEAPQFAMLAKRFGLEPFDLDVILIALAPDLDLRYERLYAYLQDDVTRRRPSVDLALNLLCAAADAKLARRAHFEGDAPLLRHRLVHLIADPQQNYPPLLAYHLKLDEQIVRLLLGQAAMDGRLAPFCVLARAATDIAELPLAAETRCALWALAGQAHAASQSLRLYFHGPRGAGKRAAADALAATLGAPLLAVDLARALEAKAEFSDLLKLIFREAWLQDAVVYVSSVDVLCREDRFALYEALQEALIEADEGMITIVAGTTAVLPAGQRPADLISVAFPMPDFAARQQAWQSTLRLAGVSLDEGDLAEIAGRYRLTIAQISGAVTAGRNIARWRTAAASDSSSPSDARPELSELFAGARAESRHELAALARKIEPKYAWERLVLPGDQLAQLREICSQARFRRIVYGDWGFDRSLSLGKGLNVLFAGAPGTGKTMAAEVIASEMHLDLYKIDLSRVVSKYIGETEKNLDRIFTAAENSNAILMFDEADALFGKRSEVRDSHDRYANIEISYLLQKMEECEGISILATNLRQNLDDAFVRRLGFIVQFPFPDESHRRRIWTGIWPRETPLADDLDFDYLARQFKLSGGNIKNIALAAAFLAVEDGGPVSMTHLLQATRREYQKIGKVAADSDFVFPVDRRQEVARALE